MCFLAIIVPGSDLKPHFTQRPHVRSGEKTVEAADAQFEELIAQRTSKAAFILAHKDETFIVDFLKDQKYITASRPVQTTWPACTLVECNQFFIVVDGQNRISVPLERVQLSRDNNGRLKFEIIAY